MIGPAPSFERNMPDINVTCAEIQTADGFEFRLPSGLLEQTLNGDCEQSWSLKVSDASFCPQTTPLYHMILF